MLLDHFHVAYSVLDNIDIYKYNFMTLWTFTEVFQHAGHKEHISISEGEVYGQPRCLLLEDALSILVN